MSGPAAGHLSGPAAGHLSGSAAGDLTSSAAGDLTSSTEVFDLAVVGGGLMGAATAWAAAGRGLSVVLFEQFAIGHDRGSSHGSARIFRYAYPDAFYVKLVGRAAEAWQELQLDSNEPLLRITGGLDHGSQREPPALGQLLAAAGIAHELLPAAEAGRRWPGMIFDSPVLFHPQAGVLDAAATVRACLRRAADSGASILADTPVQAIEPRADSALVHTESGPVRARRVAVAAGAWVGQLVDGLVPLPPITVSQELTAHFPRRDAHRNPDWPTFVYKGNDFSGYGLAAGSDGSTAAGEQFKVAEFRGGPVLTCATDRVTELSPVLSRLVDFVARRLPGLDPDPTLSTTCLFTSTPNEDFVLDRLGPLIICSPCSGHGAKFAPLIGALVADLAQDLRIDLDRFALDRYVRAVR